MKLNNKFKDHLKQAKNNKKNECYTLGSTVLEIVDLLPDIETTRFVGPCNDYDSKFTVIFKEFGYNYTGYNHSSVLDMTSPCIFRFDVVLTNPPFTGVEAWLRWLDDRKQKFAVIVPYTVRLHYNSDKLKWPKRHPNWTFRRLKNNKFMDENGNIFEYCVYLCSNYF